MAAGARENRAATTLAHTALIALGYFATAKLGLLLAIPPGFATAVWPPSGIAFAGVLLFGLRCWPGVFLGSFAVNASLASGAGGAETLARSFVIAGVIAGGASLQAALSAWLVRRAKAWPSQLESTRDIGNILFWGGPFGCLLNATVGTTVLTLAGASLPEQYVFHWTTWWAGDVVGVVVFTPMLLLLFGFGAEARARKLAVGFALVLTFLLTVGVFAAVTVHERDRQQFVFEQDAARARGLLEKDVESYLDTLAGVERFLSVSPQVSPENFAKFAENSFLDHPGLKALSWNPKVAGADRRAFEARMRATVAADYVIKDRVAPGRFAAAGQRALYFPIAYVASQESGFLAGYGFDTYGTDPVSGPVRRETIDAARDAAKIFTTGRLCIAQDTADRYGLLLYAPVYRDGVSGASAEERRRNLTGFAAGIFIIPDMIRASFAPVEPLLRGMDFTITDLDAGESLSLLYDSRTPDHKEAAVSSGKTAAAPDPQALQAVTSLWVAGHRWELHFTETAEARQNRHNWDLWVVLLGGLFFTGLFSAFLLLLTGRNDAARRLAGKLQTSETALRAMIDASQDAVVAMDEEGSITEWNRQAEATFGWTQGEAVGRLMHELIMPPARRQRHLFRLQQYLETGEGPILNQRIEVTLLNRRGVEFPVELTLTATYVDGKHRFSAFIRDLTERKKSEKDQAVLAAIVASSEDAILSKTLDGMLTSWNAGAEKLFGYGAEEALGRNVSIIIPADRLDEERRIISDLRLGANANHFETVRVTKDGRRIDVSLTVSLLRSASGAVIGVSNVSRDITARKMGDEMLQRYTHALERSNEDLQEFAHIASHDLKEPLRGLNSHASLLLDQYQGALDDKGTHRLRRMVYLSRRMGRLIEDLLYFSQLGRSELAIQDTDPNLIVEDIRLSLEPFLKERNAQVFVPQAMPRVVCDRYRIAEVFRNLITNAVKYNDKPEKLVEIGFLDKVAAPQGNRKDVFYVKDNGVGIAPEFHREVFFLFKRLGHPLEEQETGTGAGLTFVKKIIDRHHGDIWIESVPGGGTTFFFTVAPGKAAATAFLSQESDKHGE